MGSDRKNEVGDGEELRRQGARSKAKQLVRASDHDASSAPPFGGFQAHPTGRRPRGRPRIHWRDYISHLAWEHLRIPREELLGEGCPE